MRCYICDVIIPDKELKINSITGKTEPCRKCMEVIYDTTDSYEEQDVEIIEDSFEPLYENTYESDPWDQE